MTKRIETMLAQLASGELDHPDDHLLLSKLSRAIDKAIAREHTDAEWDAHVALRARMREAYEVTGPANRTARLEAACAKARQAERDARPLPGTYAHEMALMRAGLI